MKGRLRAILLCASLMAILGFLVWAASPRSAPVAVAAPLATTSPTAKATGKATATASADDSGDDSSDDGTNPTPDNTAVWFAVAGAAVLSLVAGGVVLAKR